MPLEYDEVVPWGRNYAEYVEMFRLSPEDLDKKIIGCGDGPASFNFEMKTNGKTIVSVDPLYQFTKEQIRSRIRETCDIVVAKTRENGDKFLWNKIKSVDELKSIRMAAMNVFLDDYQNGTDEGRYVNGELPELPFGDKQFDIALCSHLLFLYSYILDYSFHTDAIDEMLRVAGEIRVFPLLDSNAERSEYADRLIKYYRTKGYEADEVIVDYEFQKNGNTLLIIKNH